jgi:protein CLEC16A
MADKGFWSRLFGPSAPSAPILTLEELERLHSVLQDPENQVVNPTNKATIVETLRALAEILIWGDQNDPRIFELFLEQNMLQHFKRILEPPSHRQDEVAVQLLQVCFIQGSVSRNVLRA